MTPFRLGNCFSMPFLQTVSESTEDRHMNKMAELWNEFFLIQDWWRYQKVKELNALLSPCGLGPVSGR